MQNLFPIPKDPVQNDDTLRIRLPAALKTRVASAAAVLGLKVSAFVRLSIAQEVEEVLATQTRYDMSPADVAAFTAALDAPPPPTPAALRAARRYGERVVHAD
ncbi:MAG: DUF1778 domain-containing protein [Rhizomicrobium sp.]